MYVPSLPQKGSMIYNTAHQGNIQLVHVPPVHQTGKGGKNHFTLPKTPLKILLTPRFLIYGFTTRKHQGHTQLTWNFPWLTLTVLSSHFYVPDFQSLGEKEELGLHTLFLIETSVSSAKSSLCVLLARCIETNICLCALLARYTETNICHLKMQVRLWQPEKPSGLRL